MGKHLGKKKHQLGQTVNYSQLCQHTLDLSDSFYPMHPCDLQIEMTVTSTEVYWLQAEDEREKWRSRKGVGDTWVTAHNGVLISGSFAFVPVFFFFSL